MCRGPSVDASGPGIPAAISAALMFIGGSICLIRDGTTRLRAYRLRFLRYSIIWFMCPAMFFAGYYRTVEANTESVLKSSLANSSDATVRGIISDISLRSDGYVLTLSECDTQYLSQNYNSSKINIVIGSETDREDAGFEIGDLIEAEGKLYPFEPATNCGQFDSELYYRIRGTDAKMFAGNICIAEPFNARNSGLTGRAGYFLQRILFKLRIGLTNGIYEVLPEKEAGVLTAMLTGERGLLDSELKNLYSDGGIAHILSISALHVTLLGMGFFRLLMFCMGRLRASCILTMLLMLAYGAMTGFSVSTRRAVIMLIVTLTARMIGRAYDRLSACGLAALIILLAQPLYIYDAGFRLSFMAVIGINTMICIVDVYEIKNSVVRAFLPCIAVQLFTLPVVMGTYYEISLYAILVNPLILIFMAILLVSGAIAGGIAGVTGAGAAGLVARIFAGPVYFILKMYELLCEFELKLPYSKIVTGAPDIAAIIVYYAALGIVMMILIRKKKPRSLAGLVVCACVFIRINAPCEAYFFDVGQGDSAFIRCEGINILIDGGSSNISDIGTYRLMPALKYLGVRRLDAVIISHTDTDHVSGILKLVENSYPRIDGVFVGFNVPEDDKTIVAVREAGIPVSKMKAGDELVFGDEPVILNEPVLENEKVSDDKAYGSNEFEVLAVAPEEDAVYKDKNSASLTVKLRYKDFSILLTGDSDFASETRYVKRIDDRISVLKVAHHGSKYSTSEELLEAAGPAVAIASCSKNNRYGHPAPEMLQRLENAACETFVTPENGMISLKYYGGGTFSLSTYKLNTSGQ